MSDSNSTENIQCNFLQNFKSCYLRNNKLGGIKNLRCFPQCSDKGHCQSGFCGQSIKTQINMSDSKLNIEDLVFIGQLKPQTAMTDAKIEYSNESIDIILDNKKKHDSIYLGNIIKKSNNIYEIEYNAHPKYWTYKYESHRMKMEMKHEFIISVFLKKTIENENENENENNKYTFLKEYSSNSFEMFSQRRGYPKSPKYFDLRNEIKTLKKQKTLKYYQKNYENNLNECLKLTKYNTIERKKRVYSKIDTSNELNNKIIVKLDNINHINNKIKHKKYKKYQPVIRIESETSKKIEKMNENRSELIKTPIFNNNIHYLYENNNILDNNIYDNNDFNQLLIEFNDNIELYCNKRQKIKQINNNFMDNCFNTEEELTTHTNSLTETTELYYLLSDDVNMDMDMDINMDINMNN